MKLAFVFLAVLASIIMVPYSSAADWRVVRSFGDVQYVLVSAERENDRSIYQDVIKNLCAPNQVCVLQFWFDPKQMPVEGEDRLPPETLEARAAAYINNPASGFSSLTYACRVEYGPERCRRYTPPKPDTNSPGK